VNGPAAAPETMVQRVIAGIIYPVKGFEIVGPLVIAFLSVLPWGLGLIAPPIAAVYILTIVRASVRGSARMPSVETDDIVAAFVRAIVLLLIALLPVVAWLGFWYWTTSGAPSSPDSIRRLVPGLVWTGLLVWLYLPAALVTAAVWDSVDPRLVFKVIALGSDYWIACVVGGIALLLATFIGVQFARWSGLWTFGRMFRTFLQVWASFYLAHLVGYAVYRHAKELGWD
jgi:hypothetical protein